MRHGDRITHSIPFRFDGVGTHRDRAARSHCSDGDVFPVSHRSTHCFTAWLVGMTMWMFVLQAVLPMMLSAGVQVQVPRPALGNECATCHLRRAWTRSVTTHVDLWMTSTHAFYRVGCEKCHGGDPKTSDEGAAHRGVVNSANPSSPVHRIALPATCGRCHRSAANAFELSSHKTLLSQGDATAPTCTSCHTSMATEVPSPVTLEGPCLQCHREDPQNRARVARRALEDLARLRTSLRRAKLEIDMTKEADRKTSLTKQWTDADLSLRDVVAGIHAFDQRRVEDRLSDARAQIDRLRAELARR
jgi:Cytochrome c554 and c-prime